MRKIIASIVTLSIAVFLTSCAFPRPQVWRPDERSGLGKLDTRPENKPSSTNLIERIISVPLDPENPSAEKFDLYYFVRMPANRKATKTILWCAGGPGQIVQGPMLGTTFADFLTDNGYNIVYFHQRGAGFSQIPASNQYDRLLKTKYVVEDVEAIRRDFLGESKNWDAIIGWSYGTVVAQQYAHSHPAEVDRVILIGPQSRDKFKSSPDYAFDELTEAVRSTNRYTLQEIFDRNPNSFPKLTCSDPKCAELKMTIINTAFGTKENPGIYDKVEKVFGSVQWLVDFYCKPKTQEELKKSGLDGYSPEFFNRLRLLRMYGWLPESIHKSIQVEGANIIVDEVLSGGNYRCSGEDSEEPVGSSSRVFNVVGVYDGINASFLNQWIKNGKQRIRDALRESEGDAHLNDLEKVGIGDGDSLKPWDPADYKHNKPTLILKGGADTVSAEGQAERFYLEAATRDRTLIEFPGIGHSFGLPEIPANKPLLTGTVRLKPPPIQPGETRSVLGTYDGRTLDENFRLKLEENTLERDIKLTGLGIFENANAEDTRTQEPNIVALIENTGESSADGGRRKWTVSNKLFRGGVYFDPPPIDPGKTIEVQGTIEETWPDHVIHFKKPDGLEPGLEVVCVKVDEKSLCPDCPPDKFLVFWFQNTSSGPLKWERREWLVSNGRFSRTVSFDPRPNPIIPPGKVVQKGVPLPFGFDVDTETTPIDPEVESVEHLRGCLPPRQSGIEETYITILNTASTPVNGANRKWEIKNPMARWSMEVDPPEFKQLNDGDKVPATNIKVEEWKYPILNKPASLEPGLQFRGYNIESADKVSVLLRNNSQIVVNPVARDWVYLDPNEGSKSAACFKRSTALDCLIYSFLVMGPEAFNNAEDNKIIGIVRGFRGAKVCCRNGDGQCPGNSVGDACP